MCKIFDKSELQVISNVKYLFLNQVLTYFLPFLLIPYLMRILGLNYFGMYAFSLALFAYVGLVIEYGFNLSATKAIASSSNNTEGQISKVFSETISAKIILLLPATIFLLVAINLSSNLNEEKLFIFTWLAVVTQGFIPTWLFQGIQRMELLSFFNAIPKLLQLVGVLIFVRTPEDCYLVPLLLFLSNLITLWASMLFISNVLNCNIYEINFKEGAKKLFETRYIFLSQVKISLFSNSTTVILGFASTSTAVAYYVAAEKLMRALSMLQTPIVGSLYPYMSKNIHLNRAKSISLIKVAFKYGAIFYLLISLLTFIFAKKITFFIFGNDALGSFQVLRILSFVPLFIYINNLCGTQIMINMGMDKKFFQILLFGGLVNVVLCLILVPNFQENGAAISVFVVELIIALLMYFSVYKVLHE